MKEKDEGKAIESNEVRFQLLAMETSKIQLKLQEIETRLGDLAERFSALETNMQWIKALLLIILGLLLSQVGALTIYFFKQLV